MNNITTKTATESVVVTIKKPRAKRTESAKLSATKVPVASIMLPRFDVNSLEAERADLEAFANSGDDYDTSDPRWERYLKLRELDEAQEKKKSVNKNRQYADGLISDSEAIKMNFIGTLETGDDDYLEIHTKEAFRLFIGRVSDDENNRKPVISGRKVASVLRFLWLQTGNDNPYSDWLLLQVESNAQEVIQSLRKVSSRYEQEMDVLKKRGLSYSVMRAKNTQKLSLGFKSPYGFLIAELIVEFDYTVRAVKTMVAKNRLSKEEGRDSIYILLNLVRRFFENIIPIYKVLKQDVLMDLGRIDWLSKDPIAINRVQAVTRILGECPREVFDGSLAPRNTRRLSDDISSSQIKALRTVNLSIASDSETETKMNAVEGALYLDEQSLV
jgi:integrating conjugative element protein (TIGR03761 family)